MSEHFGGPDQADEPSSYGGLPNVAVLGTVIKPPEERYGKESGKPYVTATLAINGRDKVPNYWDVTAFDDRVRSDLKAVPSGALVMVHGALGVGSWERKDGTREIRASVVAKRVDEIGLTRIRRDRRDLVEGDDGPQPEAPPPVDEDDYSR
jgi:single-stranded DNA-binding protein